VQEVGSILPGTAIDRGEWQIQAPDLSLLQVRVELIASFKKTPDLQFAEALPTPLLHFDLPKTCTEGDPLVFKLALWDAPKTPWEFELKEGDGDWSPLAAAKEGGAEISQTGSVATLKLKAGDAGSFTFHARAVAVGTRAVIAVTTQTMVCNPKQTQVTAPVVRPTPASAGKAPAVLLEYQNATAEWNRIKNANPRPSNYQQVSDKYQAAYRRYIEFMQNPGAAKGP
jgi:hypothetical protein